MAHISRDEILKIAQLSFIELQEHEIQPLREQLEQVLTYAARVKEGAKIAEDLVQKNINIFREDAVLPYDAHALVAVAPESEGNYFVVPVILENN